MVIFIIYNVVLTPSLDRIDLTQAISGFFSFGWNTTHKSLELGKEITYGTVKMSKETAAAVVQRMYGMATSVLPSPMKARVDAATNFGQRALNQPFDSTLQEVRPMLHEKVTHRNNV